MDRYGIVGWGNLRCLIRHQKKLSGIDFVSPSADG